MRHRLLAFTAIVSLTVAPALAQNTAKPWAQTKTPWGNPDLQGTWTSDDYISVPLQRAADAGTRLTRNEQETAMAEQNIKNTTMNYQAVIDDPQTFTNPFTIGFPITREPGYEIFEYACHEGNTAMTNSLSGARALERR